MNPLASVARAGGRLLSGRAGRGGGVVLCYHDVVAGPDVDVALSVTVEQLRQHLVLARRLGFEMVSLVELSHRAVAGRPVDGLAAVAFDDSLSGVARHALPVLDELAVPATLFTVSTGWGRRPHWWKGAGRTMTREELVECRAHGLDIAAHTRTHASLTGLSGPERAAQLRDEVAGSREELEDLLGETVDVFAYPFGHHDAHVREAVREAGYAAAYTFLNGRISGGEDPLKLPRFTMGHHHDRARLAYHLARPPRSWPDHQHDRVSGEGG